MWRDRGGGQTQRFIIHVEYQILFCLKFKGYRPYIITSIDFLLRKVKLNVLFLHECNAVGRVLLKEKKDELYLVSRPFCVALYTE